MVLGCDCPFHCVSSFQLLCRLSQIWNPNDSLWPTSTKDKEDQWPHQLWRWSRCIRSYQSFYLQQQRSLWERFLPAKISRTGKVLQCIRGLIKQTMVLKEIISLCYSDNCHEQLPLQTAKVISYSIREIFNVSSQADDLSTSKYDVNRRVLPFGFRSVYLLYNCDWFCDSWNLK